MRRIVLLMVLFFTTCSIPVMAQAYYFYDTSGKKTTLTLNENKVVVSIPKEYEEISKRIRANVEVLVTASDRYHDIFFITHSDFDKLSSQDFWEEDVKSVILTPSYYMWDDRLENYKEAFLGPYLSIKLKKEEDIDLLNLYVEKYSLNIVRHSLVPLWYLLAVTKDSDNNSLECANEIFENGDFEVSSPEFVFIDNDWTLGPNAIRSISITTPEESSEIYDLHGRKLTSKPTSGIYIHRGQKKLARSRK